MLSIYLGKMDKAIYYPPSPPVIYFYLQFLFYKIHFPD